MDYLPLAPPGKPEGISMRECKPGLPSFSRRLISEAKANWDQLHHLQFSSVQLLSRVRLFATPRTAARQASLSFTISQSVLKFMSMESVMPSNRLILYRPLLLPSNLPSIRVFSNELEKPKPLTLNKQ